MGVEEVGDPVLGPRNEVGLDPELERRAGDEVAIGVEVVDGLLDPERVPPDRQRGGKAVDVLGDAELGDAGRLGRRPVAIDVARR